MSTIERITTDDSATARMAAARRNRQRIIDERNLLLSIVAHLWPAHLTPPSTQQSASSSWQWVLCIHSPQGQLCWHITNEEADGLFAYLPRSSDSDWDGHRHMEKLERLKNMNAMKSKALIASVVETLARKSRL